MKHSYQTPNLSHSSFAKTNAQTIAQRIQLVRELLPETRAIGELCCGDCRQQWQAYREQLGIQHFGGLDLNPIIVDHNRTMGISCVAGDVLDPAVLRQFLAYDLLFFGPPLSVACDGHRSLRYSEVIPSYEAVAQLLWGELHYTGTFVCICPKTTTMGEIAQLWQQVQSYDLGIGLPLIHYSYATLTGAGIATDLRLKYVELWFSRRLADEWVVRESRG